jgi:hypothetical protein
LTNNICSIDSLQDLQKSAKDFDGLSGKYNIRLIVGDAVVSNAIDWHLVSLNALRGTFVHDCFV